MPNASKRAGYIRKTMSKARDWANREGKLSSLPSVLLVAEGV